MSNEQLGYLLFRVTMGVNMLVHGAVRLFGDWAGFINGVVGQFHETLLPEAFTFAFAAAVPVVEFCLGVLLILGLFTRYALAVGACLILSLMCGMGLLEKWSVVGDQMIYALGYFFLLLYSKYDWNWH